MCCANILSEVNASKAEDEGNYFKEQRKIRKWRNRNKEERGQGWGDEGEGKKEKGFN